MLIASSQLPACFIHLEYSMAAREEQVVIAFDLYGTLLSTESIAEELASHFGREKAMEVAALWRRYQLEYTWRLNSMSRSLVPWQGRSQLD